MKYLFYTTSQTAWEGLRKAIEKAEKSIYLEMYIFVDDTPEADYLIETFCRKAEKGVEVRIILDGFGSYGLSRKAIDKLQGSGVEILFFKKIFRRLHRKFVVIDEKVGFLGGVNIHKTARLWNDLLVRLEGPILRSMIRSFRRTYEACGGTDPYILHYEAKPAILGRTRTWILEHFPAIRTFRLRDTYIETMMKAEHTITFVTPYFLPHQWLITLMKESVRRGLKVEVVVPLETDILFLTTANRYYMSLLAGYGVTFYQTKEMTHAKLLVIDDKLALLGSNNIDALSFDFNAEIGVFFQNEAAIKDLRAIVNKWKATSTIFVEAKHYGFVAKMFSVFFRIFQPFL
jgi:cardiolipin synthase